MNMKRKKGKTMNDLISRAEAIDAFNTNLNELVVGGEENAKTVENYLNRVLDKIKCLPSALGTNLAEVGTNAISRQSAIEVIERARAHIGHNMERSVGRVFLEMLDDVGLSISKLPTIQPKRGRWHYSDGKPATIGLSFGVICDKCGTESEYCTNFCGECGADMRQKGENSESN